MAGEVRTDSYRVPGVSVLDLVARLCPVTQRYGQVCTRFDPHSGELKVCPFWYGLSIDEGTWHFGEARSLTEARAWLSTQEGGTRRDYTVRCLRKESAGLEPGAR